MKHRFRATKLIDNLSSPETAGKQFALDLLNQHLYWDDLQIQITGVHPRVLTDIFWQSFFTTFKEQAPDLFLNILSVEWILDHATQEAIIREQIFNEPVTTLDC